VQIDHPLHLAVANEIEGALDEDYRLLRDPACGGIQLLSLFAGERRGRDTRMCCVDLLVLHQGRVRAIVEIEESGFLPTKICGKVLQAALAIHYIADSPPVAVPYGPEVLFLQVLDSSRSLKPGSKKRPQAMGIEREIRKLGLKGITDYQLLFASIAPGDEGMKEVRESVSAALGKGGARHA
jgi:hypothetical protein